MTSPPDARDPSAPLTVADSRQVADVLIAVVAAPGTLATLTALWAAVAWLGTQIPQQHVPHLTTDGLPRSELLALHALGLDNLAWSLPFWLLAGLTAFAAIARALTVPLARRLDYWLLALALPLLAVSWLRLTGEAPAVLLEIPVGADLAVVPAWRADGGGVAPAPGRWQAACRAHAGSAALDCAVNGAGLHHLVAVAPGSPAHDQGQQFTWLMSGPATLPKQMTLNWQARADRHELFALNLEDAVESRAPSLAAQLAPSVLKEAGPLVLVSDTAPPMGMRLLASPDVLPAGRATAQIVAPPVVRIQVAPSRSALPLLLAFLALAAAFAAPLLRPGTAPRTEV